MGLLGCSSVAFMACGTSSRDDAALGTGSWEVNLAVNVTGTILPISLSCSSVKFTMHLEAGSEGLDATLGHDGEVTVGRLVANDRTYGLADALSVPDLRHCGAWMMQLTQLSLHASDTGGGGAPDEISGSGIGSGNILLGDVGYPFTFSYQLSGTPDRTRPTLLTTGEGQPLDGVFLRTSEPLALSSQLRLEGTLPLTLQGADADTGALGVFSSDVILPFSGAWTVAGTAADLNGLPIDLGASVTSLADPGVFAEDGFEGIAPAVILNGDARIVSGIGTLPAIGGGRCLLVAPGSSATLHLARPPGASSIRLLSRSLAREGRTPDSVFDLGPAVRAGVVGGTARPTPTWTTTGNWVPTGDPTWLQAGPVRDVTIPLTEAGTDIVLEIEPYECVGYCPPSQAMLIDDVRVLVD